VTRIPTVIKSSSEAYRRGQYQCSACWEVVDGRRFDSASALCVNCARELGYLPKGAGAPTPVRFDTDTDPLHTLTHPFACEKAT